jgi:hypothetical protein
MPEFAAYTSIINNAAIAIVNAAAVFRFGLSLMKEFLPLRPSAEIRITEPRQQQLVFACFSDCATSYFRHRARSRNPIGSEAF